MLDALIPGSSSYGDDDLYSDTEDPDGTEVRDSDGTDSDAISDSSLAANYGGDEEPPPLLAYATAEASAEWCRDAERRAAERAAAGTGVTLRRPHRSPLPLRPMSF